jgi:hypothetical protein
MNSNWTGRSPRTLSACSFQDDADPFDFRRRRTTSNGEIAAYIVALLVVLLVVHLVAR